MTQKRAQARTRAIAKAQANATKESAYVPDPPPRSCPKCRGRRLRVSPPSRTGLIAWMCLRNGCHAIGHGERCVGDPTGHGVVGVRAGR